MSPEISIYSFYASEPRPKSTWKFNMNKKFLCGMPTSPEPFTTTTISEDQNSDFKFLDGSNRPHVGDSDLDDAALIRQEVFQVQHKKALSFPRISFLDETFRDGKIMQLKLPPRYLNNTDENFGRKSSTPAKSPARRKAKKSIRRQRLWNDCFDPFLVALENVKGDYYGKLHGINHKGARSMLSLWADSESGLIDSVEWEYNGKGHKQLNPKPIMPSVKPIKNEGPVRAPRFEVPKGVLYARKLRQMEMGTKLGQKAQ